MSKFNEFNRWEASGLVGVGGMQAAIETVKLFDDLGLRRIGRNIDIVYHDQADGKLYGSNIVCIGGPDANSLWGAGPLSTTRTSSLAYTQQIGHSTAPPVSPNGDHP